MEKRILIAAILSAVFMTIYAQTMLKGSGVGLRRPATSTVSVDALEKPAPQLLPPPGIEEETILLESSRIQLEIGKTSAAIRSVVLKDFLDASRIGPLRIRSDQPLVSALIGNAPLRWELIHQAQGSVSFKAKDSESNDYYISFEIKQDNQFMDIVLRDEMINDIVDKKSLSLLTTWTKGDKLNDRYNSLELYAVQIDTGKKLKYSHFRAPIKQKRDVPRGTSLLSLSERYFCQVIKSTESTGAVTLVPIMPEMLAAQFKIAPSADGAYRASIYFGPRDYFYLKAAGFEDAFPIGMLGQIGLLMLSLLSWIAKLTHNHGVAVILFSALVTCALSPFTMISFRSMKKMQELKPQMDRITAKHKDNPQEANRAVFALYREHRVSPLSGCLPMLLQLPVFFALFQAISHYVELRGERFLWVADLSLPDRIAKLPFTLPLLGSDINLLPILMALAMFVQQKASQKNMPSSGTNPAMNLMSGPMMAVLFGVMFYQVPSGLVLYWLTNSLISLVWYRVAK